AFLDPKPRGSIEVAVHLGAFKEFAARPARLEILDRDEVVFAAVLVPRTRGPCRVGDRQRNGAVFRKQRIDQGRLACTRRCDDQEDVAREFLRMMRPMCHRFTPGSGSARASVQSATSALPQLASFRSRWLSSRACWLRG